MRFKLVCLFIGFLGVLTVSSASPSIDGPSVVNPGESETFSVEGESLGDLDREESSFFPTDGEQVTNPPRYKTPNEGFNVEYEFKEPGHTDLPVNFTMSFIGENESGEDLYLRKEVKVESDGTQSDLQPELGRTFNLEEGQRANFEGRSTIELVASDPDAEEAYSTTEIDTGGDVFSVEAEDENLYIGSRTEGGGRLTKIENGQEDLINGFNSRVVDIAPRGEEVYVVTNNGLYRIEGESIDQGPNSEFIRGRVAAGDENIYAAPDNGKIHKMSTVSTSEWNVSILGEVEDIVFDSGSIYVGSSNLGDENGRLVKLDENGNELENESIPTTSLGVTENNIYSAHGHVVKKLSKSDLSNEDEFELRDRHSDDIRDMEIVSGNAYIASDSSNIDLQPVYKYDLSSGDELWRYDLYGLGGDFSSNAVAVDEDGKVYAGGHPGSVHKLSQVESEVVLKDGQEDFISFSSNGDSTTNTFENGEFQVTVESMNTGSENADLKITQTSGDGDDGDGGDGDGDDGSDSVEQEIIYDTISVTEWENDDNNKPQTFEITIESTLSQQLEQKDITLDFTEDFGENAHHRKQITLPPGDSKETVVEFTADNLLSGDAQLENNCYETEITIQTGTEQIGTTEQTKILNGEPDQCPNTDELAGFQTANIGNTNTQTETGGWKIINTAQTHSKTQLKNKCGQQTTLYTTKNNGELKLIPTQIPGTIPPGKYFIYTTQPCNLQYMQKTYNTQNQQLQTGFQITKTTNTKTPQNCGQKFAAYHTNNQKLRIKRNIPNTQNTLPPKKYFIYTQKTQCTLQNTEN